MKQLAIHEAIPGHYLQSVIWQRAFASGDAPRGQVVRFLGVADDVAMAYGYYGTMVSVEGWAVHMERLLGSEGFYDETEHLFFSVCEAIRAVRVILDLEIHAGDLDADAAARFAAEATLMPESWAKWQALRVKRMPLQGLTYLVGADEIARLRAATPSSTTEAFHRALLALGPVPPSRAKARLA
jgi:uncharacterized protein (DUF885 family)